MKNIAIVMCVLIVMLAFAACSVSTSTEEENEGKVLMDGYFILSDATNSVSVSVKVSNGTVESALLANYSGDHDSYRDESWTQLKSQIEGLDYAGLTALAAGDSSNLSVKIVEAVKKLSDTTTDHIVYDFAPKNTVSEFAAEFRGLITSADTGYYSDKTTYVEVSADVDYKEYGSSEIIAISLNGENGRVVPIFDMEDYSPGYYRMGPGGPELVEYNEIHNANGLTIIIGVEVPEQDDINEPEVSVSHEVKATASLIDFRNELASYGITNIAFHKGTSSKISEEITDIDTYAKNNPFARVSSFAAFDSSDARTNMVVYYEFKWMGMGSAPDVTVKTLKAAHILRIFVGGAEGEGTKVTFSDATDLSSVGSDLLKLVGSGMGGQNPVYVMLNDDTIEAVTTTVRFEELESQGYKFDVSGQTGGNIRFYTSEEDYIYAAYNTKNSAWEMMSRGQWLGPVTQEHFTSGVYKAVLKLGK